MTTYISSVFGPGIGSSGLSPEPPALYRRTHIAAVVIFTALISAGAAAAVIMFEVPLLPAIGGSAAIFAAMSGGLTVYRQLKKQRALHEKEIALEKEFERLQQQEQKLRLKLNHYSKDREEKLKTQTELSAALSQIQTIQQQLKKPAGKRLTEVLVKAFSPPKFSAFKNIDAENITTKKHQLNRDLSRGFICRAVRDNTVLNLQDLLASLTPQQQAAILEIASQASAGMYMQSMQPFIERTSEISDLSMLIKPTPQQTVIYQEGSSTGQLRTYIIQQVKIEAPSIFDLTKESTIISPGVDLEEIRKHFKEALAQRSGFLMKCELENIFMSLDGTSIDAPATILPLPKGMKLDHPLPTDRLKTLCDTLSR